MAGILSSALHASANPKQRSEVTVSKFDCLNKKTALILFAAAEAVLGEGFLLKAPKFIETVDDFLNYQRPAQREVEGSAQEVTGGVGRKQDQEVRSQPGQRR